MKSKHTAMKSLGIRTPVTIGLLSSASITLMSWLFLANRDNLQQLVVSPAARERFFTSLTTSLQDFMTLALSIVIEAAPFIVLGVTISVVVQSFSLSNKLLARLPKNKLGRALSLSFAGIAMPVCECGNVPVARSLMIKGLSARDSMVFLLSAPSINIVTFLATWEAFNFNRGVAIVRVCATLILANLTAYIVTRYVNPEQLLDKNFSAICKERHDDHGYTWTTMLSLFRSELWQIMRLLILGATIAAASQIIIPRDIITSIADNPLLAVFAMLILAFVVSICSSVDAFFALAYAHVFSVGALVTFLVAGPMVDIKMLTLLKTTFTARTLLVLTACVAIGAAVIGLGLSYVW